MRRDEWFRSPRWDAAQRERFETKLARARPANRAQYLRLKGLALSAASDRAVRAGARDLFERVIASGNELQAAMARADLARWFEQTALPRDAANMYRECLQAEDQLDGHLRTGSELDLVELIVRERWDNDYDEALRLLDRAAAVGLTFEVQRWRYLVASARIYARRGQDNDAREAASEAIRIAETSKPDFARHPEVGRVSPDRRTLREMRRLAK